MHLQPYVFNMSKRNRNIVSHIFRIFIEYTHKIVSCFFLWPLSQREKERENKNCNAEESNGCNTISTNEL